MQYYVSGKERAPRVQRLFNRIACRYDLINDLQSCFLHRLWKRRFINMAIKFLEGKKSPRCLDLCCGTGDIAIGLAEALRQKGTFSEDAIDICGVDFCTEMLTIAKERAQKRTCTYIRWQQADVLRFSDDLGGYDVVTCAYGVRNLADIPLALTKMRQLLRPGGLLLILEFGKPDFFLMRWFYRLYLKFGVPIIGFLVCHDVHAFSYILDSLDHYPGQHGITKILENPDSGFQDVRCYSIIGGTMTIHRAKANTQ